mmetsp:Transcript_39847/g.55350  ORF Transcript_39847/g.55350 Transcript_39847/m.55350 type:complete len:413 (+) Transcript_39847:111-1349(+)
MLQPAQYWVGPDGGYYVPSLSAGSLGRVRRLSPPSESSPETPSLKSGASLPKITFEGLFRENVRGLREAVFRLRNRDQLAGMEVVFLGKSTPSTARFVILQLEQLDSACLNPHHEDFNPKYLQALQRAQAVWDCCPANVSLWQRLGMKSFFVPLWSTLPQSAFITPTLLADVDPLITPTCRREESNGCLRNKKESKDLEGPVDVLLFGTLNQRRLDIGARLRAVGLHVVVRCFTQIEEQDKYIRSARIIINVHFYESASLEVHRVDPLLARGKCVVSEVGGDAALDAIYSQVLTFAPYEDLVSAVKSLLLSGTTNLNARALAGHRFMKERNSAYPWELHCAVEGMQKDCEDQHISSDLTVAVEAPDTRDQAWNNWLAGVEKQDTLSALNPLPNVMGEAVWKILGQWQDQQAK